MSQKNRFFQPLKALFTFLVLSPLCQSAMASGNADGEISTEYYKVIDNKVDPETFIGWRVYHNVCVECHGVGGTGTDVAPDLTQSIKKLSPEEFRIKVLHTYAVRYTLDDWRTMEQAMYEEIIKQEQRDRGMLETMPRWQYNPAVRENIQNIYRYLRARSDGAIGDKKPGILKD